MASLCIGRMQVRRCPKIRGEMKEQRLITHNPNETKDTASIRLSRGPNRFGWIIGQCITLAVIMGASTWSFAQSPAEDDQSLLTSSGLSEPAPDVLGNATGID